MPSGNLIAEFISGKLAESLGLSLPDIKIVYVPDELTEFMPEYRNEIHEGYAFASLFIAGAVELSYLQAHNSRIVPVADQKLIYVFDRWVINIDRSLTRNGGNINMLHDVANDKYYLIDHNLSFDHSEKPEDFDVHVYSPANRKWLFDLIDRMECEQKLRNTLPVIKKFIAEIPDEWLNDESLLPFIEGTLARVGQEAFWSKIV